MWSLGWLLIRCDRGHFKMGKFGSKHTGECYMKMKAEIFKPMDAKGCQQLPGAQKHIHPQSPQKEPTQPSSSNPKSHGIS